MRETSLAPCSCHRKNRLAGLLSQATSHVARCALLLDACRIPIFIFYCIRGPAASCRMILLLVRVLYDDAGPLVRSDQ